MEIRYLLLILQTPKQISDAEHKEIRGQLRLMRESFERGLYEGEEYQYWQKVNGLKEKLELLNSIPEAANERAALTLLNLHDSWEWATREERKMLVRTMARTFFLDARCT